VASAVISPAEALVRFNAARACLGSLSVVGIAGPGDALANWPQVEETFRLIRSQDPLVSFCLSTNGLLLPRFVESLERAGVSHVTVTVNTVDPAIGAQIYGRVVLDGKAYKGEEAAGLLLDGQLNGIRLLTERGICVKVNTVLIAGINDAHVEEVARTASMLGASCQNITAMIAVPGAAFQERAPVTAAALSQARDECRAHLRQIYHCRQCRSDAVGLLGNDISPLIEQICQDMRHNKEAHGKDDKSDGNGNGAEGSRNYGKSDMSGDGAEGSRNYGRSGGNGNDAEDSHHYDKEALVR
jgi:nitrogenase cofactor biosynthesis protein NifB